MTRYERWLAHRVWAWLQDQEILLVRRNIGGGQTRLEDTGIVLLYPSREAEPDANRRLTIIVHEAVHCLQYQRGWKSLFWMELVALAVDWVLVPRKKRWFIPYMIWGMKYSWWKK
jgi:hypothetical protein